MDDVKEKRRYWKLEEEAVDRTLWRTCFGRVYGPVVESATELINSLINTKSRSDKLHNEKLNNLLSLPNILKVFKLTDNK
jgi:hypothetical protein